jgi:ADP-heptose:LPS heptosyltransferase
MTSKADFILLDRSGSMESLWVEALGSVNAYVKKLLEEKVDTKVTLAAFDENSGGLDFKILRDAVSPADWKDVTGADASPRGMTPLNDATAKLVNLAKGVSADNTAIIIMTDGAENASREITVAQAKALLEDCRTKGWQVIFLGANFDNATQAQHYGNLAQNTVSSSKRNLGATMTATASMRASYATTGKAMSYSDDQKTHFSTK